MIDWKGALRKLASELGLARGKDSNSVAQHPNKPNVTPSPGSPSTANRHEGTGLHPAARTAHTRPREDAGRPGMKSGAPSNRATRTKTAAKEDKGPSKDEKKKPRQLRSASQGPFPTPEMRKYPVGYEDCDGLKAQQWQSLGASSAIGRAQPGRRSLCTLGLDFGTAFTKACVQVRNSAYVVHWDRCVSSFPPFLLPSMFSELPDGTCVLGSHTGARQYSDLKMALLGNPTRFDQTAAVVFIALVTRYVRAWLFTEHRSVVDGYALDWSMNVGLPASSWDSAEKASLYKLLSVAGWRLGAANGPINLAMADAALLTAGSHSSDQISAEMIETFPEFGAQVHSYRSSSQRQRDLHLLVDVGAGTVDVVTFHIGEEDESEINCILEPIVKKLGTHILLAYRAQAGFLDGRTWTDQAARLNRGLFESSFGLLPGSLNAVQEHFSDLLHLSIRKVLHVTKSSRYETSPRWTEGVPFFLSGGGRNVDAFREAIRKATSERKMIELSLPVPDRVVLGKVSPHDFHRLSVAHGLSSSAENLAKTLRRSEVPDLQRVRAVTTDYTERYIDK